MAVNSELANQAQILPIDLNDDFLFALEAFCRVHGYQKMSQAALKALQAIPIIWAALSMRDLAISSSVLRDRAAAKCIHEVAIPGFVKLVQKAVQDSGGVLRMPFKWEDAIFNTTLGTGKGPPKTFIDKPARVLSKFRAIKAEFTKAFLWFESNKVEQLPSGTTTQDYLRRLNAYMYRQKMEEVDLAKDSDSGGEADGEVPPTRAKQVEGVGSSPVVAQLQSSQTAANSQDPSTAEAAAPTPRDEGEGKSGAATGNTDEVEVPTSWHFPYLLVAAAFSPWSGRAPSGWDHIDVPRGQSHKRKSHPGDENAGDDSSQVCGAVSKLKSNGDTMSRRQHIAAGKLEKEMDMKAGMERERKEDRKTVIELKRKMLVATEATSSILNGIGVNLKRIVELHERQNRIYALEKKLMLGVGNLGEVRAELTKLLDEC